MKYFTLILLALPALASAQRQTSSYSVVSSYTPATESPVSPIIINPGVRGNYELPRVPGMRMRNAGRTMTIIGGALFTTGIVLVSTSDKETEYYYNSYGQIEETVDPKLVLGVVSIMGGVGLMVPGVILWSKGAKKYNRYLEREGARNRTARVNIRGNGMALTYSF